jgi:hypothetical protein
VRWKVFIFIFTHKRISKGPELHLNGVHTTYMVSREKKYKQALDITKRTPKHNFENTIKFFSIEEDGELGITARMHLRRGRNHLAMGMR